MTTSKNTWTGMLDAQTYELIEPKIEDIVTNVFVKNLRNKFKMSQASFAYLVGVSKKTVEKWEQGVNKIKGGDSRLLYLLNIDDSLRYLLMNLKESDRQQQYKMVNCRDANFKIEYKPITSRTGGSQSNFELWKEM